jgi:outer membrane protein
MAPEPRQHTVTFGSVRAPKGVIALATCLAFGTPRVAAAQSSAMAQPRPPISGPVDSVPAYPMLTLGEVVERALAVSPTVASGVGGVRDARSTQRVAFGAYLPTLAATSAATRTDAPGALTTRNQTFGLATAVDLYTGGRRRANEAFARAELRAARLTLVSARYTIAFVAQQAFYEVIRATEFVGVARAGLAEAGKLLRYTQDMSRAGTAMRSDVLRAQLQVTTMREQLIAGSDTLVAAVYALGWLTGADGPVGAKADSASQAICPLALEDSVILRLAADASPSVTVAEAVAAADRAALRAARTQYIPTISATAGYNWAANSTGVTSGTVTTGGTRPGWTITLGTSYPLFTGFQREDVVVRAEVAADVARVAAADARRAARASAAQLLSALRTAETSMALGAEAVRSTREDLRVQIERYRAGISTMLDVLTSETALVQAEYGLAFARHRYHTTRAALEALVGRPL